MASLFLAKEVVAGFWVKIPKISHGCKLDISQLIFLLLINSMELMNMETLIITR